MIFFFFNLPSIDGTLMLLSLIFITIYVDDDDGGLIYSHLSKLCNFFYYYKSTYKVAVGTFHYVIFFCFYLLEKKTKKKNCAIGRLIAKQGCEANSIVSCLR